MTAGAVVLLAVGFSVAKAFSLFWWRAGGLRRAGRAAGLQGEGRPLMVSTLDHIVSAVAGWPHPGRQRRFHTA